MTITVKLHNQNANYWDSDNYNLITCQWQSASLQVRGPQCENRSPLDRLSRCHLQAPPPLSFVLQSSCRLLSYCLVKNLKITSFGQHHPCHQSTCWSSGQGRVSVVLQRSWPAFAELLIWTSVWSNCMRRLEFNLIWSYKKINLRRSGGECSTCLIKIFPEERQQTILSFCTTCTLDMSTFSRWEKVTLWGDRKWYNRQQIVVMVWIDR